jgi:hypothetical protein
MSQSWPFSFSWLNSRAHAILFYYTVQFCINLWSHFFVCFKNKPIREKLEKYCFLIGWIFGKTCPFCVHPKIQPIRMQYFSSFPLIGWFLKHKKCDHKLMQNCTIPLKLDPFRINSFVVKYFLWCVPEPLKIICQPSKVHRQVTHKSCTFWKLSDLRWIITKNQKNQLLDRNWEKEKITCCSPRYFEGRGPEWNRTRQL